MKKIALVLMMFAGLASCKKSEETTKTDDAYKCTTCTTTPEAKEQYNASSAGVYKGVIVGSSGTIAMYLFNTGTEVKALVAFDGQSGTLSTTALGNWAPGQAIKNALFTGVINGQNVEATFSVDANGQNPTVDVKIPGHTVVVAIYKETSATLIKNYEGTYSGSSSGIFNMVVSGNDYSIVTNGGGAPMRGTLSNGQVDMLSGTVEVKGTFSGEKIDGTWKNSKDNTSGTWTGKRTL